jgi:hypothetical protein
MGGKVITGHAQKNGAVSIVFTIETAPFFCVYSVLVISVSVESLYSNDDDDDDDNNNNNTLNSCLFVFSLRRLMNNHKPSICLYKIIRAGYNLLQSMRLHGA